MKVQIPDNLKADMPQTTWGKILSATPVVMAVVATMLAGLASSEMTRAQYDRALAAQQQSKAGDQWSFFQAKRLRGSLQRNSIDLIQSVAQTASLNPEALKAAAASHPETAALLGTETASRTLALLVKGQLPPLPPAPQLKPEITEAIHGVETLQPDGEVNAMLAKISTDDLASAIKAARDHSQAMDAATSPVNKTIDELEAALGRISTLGKPGEPSVLRDFTLARLRFTASRYEAEARVNQSIANIYELQVRKSNISAQRHHIRSQRFFLGMLAAQAAVIISTFAMAARKRNVLWSIAAAAGLLAVAFAIYVYLYM